MSQSAPGTFFRRSLNVAMAIFVLDGIQYTFIATAEHRLPAFTSNHATVHYNSEVDLASTQDFDGTVGTQTFRLNLANGVTIDGELNVPGIFPAVTITGNGKWEHS